MAKENNDLLEENKNRATLGNTVSQAEEDKKSDNSGSINSMIEEQKEKDA